MRAKEELPEMHSVATAVSHLGGEKGNCWILRNLKERPWRFNDATDEV